MFRCKRKSKKECKVRFSLRKKNKAFQKKYMKVGVKKLLRVGTIPARTWEPMLWGCLQRRG